MSEPSLLHDDSLLTETADRLHSAAIHLLRRLRQQDSASGLTAPRLSALSVIVFAGPLTLRALAAAEQVRPPTMSRIVDALEDAGLATREASVDDHREVRISATPIGTRVLEDGRARRTTKLAGLLAALPSDELATLHRAAQILDRISRGDTLRAARPQDAPGEVDAENRGEDEAGAEDDAGPLIPAGRLVHRDQHR